MENSIEEDIKIAVDKFSDNKDIDSAMLIVEKFILGNYILLGGNRGNIVKDSLRYILSDYKRVLKENETYQKSDYETICLENNELREMTDRIQSEYNDLLKDNFKLKNELETKRKEYQETYKDVREELKELRKENKEVKENCKKCIIRDELDEYVNNSISIKKVKDKIEELKKKVEELTDDKGYWGGSDLLEQIKVLQELLEKEK